MKLVNFPGDSLSQGLSQSFGEVAMAKLDQVLERLDEIERRLPGRPRPRPRPRDSGSSRRGVMAASFVATQLRVNGPMPWKKVVALGAEYGHAERTLERHRNKVAVSVRIDGHWVWRLKNNGEEGHG